MNREKLIQRLRAMRPTVLDALYESGWEDQKAQYPQEASGDSFLPGSANVAYFLGRLSDTQWVDCLLFYQSEGRLVGILNHYPQDILPYERKGNISIWVDPDYNRQGVATTLLRTALGRWDDINLLRQDYTEAGLRFVIRFLEKGES